MTEKVMQRTPEEIEAARNAPEVEWINGYPTPPSMPVRPVHAVVSMLRLIRNKEDTRQVFEILQAMSGRSTKNLFERFSASPYGKRVVEGEARIEHLLGDREKLRMYPEGTVARVYLDFMEGENLTPEGLMSASGEAGIDYEAYPEYREYMRMGLHLQMIHDLWHVLTGYGRDALGELCNLVYTRHQSYNPGFRLIVGMGLVAQKMEHPGQPFRKALAEANRNAKKSAWVMEHDVEELLALPLTEARARLNLAEPTVYNAIPADIKDNLLKPKVMETQAQREQAAMQRAA